MLGALLDKSCFVLEHDQVSSMFADKHEMIGALLDGGGFVLENGQGLPNAYGQTWSAWCPSG